MAIRWNIQIKEARRNKKLTQREVAEVANITPRAYQAIEAGTSWPHYDTLTTICKLLGLKSLTIL